MTSAAPPPAAPGAATPGAPMLVSGVRHPTNVAYQHRGSIHDDETARKLGFRGGTIAGAQHMDQFVPLLVDAFGARWFESGGLSLYFRHATTDGEPVIASVGRPVESGDAQVPAAMHTPEGVLVAEGTAAIGRPAEPSALSARDLRHDPTGVRILAGLGAGDEIASVVRRTAGDDQRARLVQGLFADPLAWYEDGSPWGLPVVAPSTAVNLFTHAASERLLPRIGRAVGLWGAIEVGHVAGPLLVDTDYELSGRIAALGDSPKTEILWYDMEARVPGGPVVATLRILTRFVKASSPLYA